MNNFEKLGLVLMWIPLLVLALTGPPTVGFGIAAAFIGVSGMVIFQMGHRIERWMKG